MPALAVGGGGVSPSNVEILMALSRIAIEVASREGGASGSWTTDDWSSAPAEESLWLPSNPGRSESPPSLFSSGVPTTLDISLPQVGR
jgi:hypothetical protein